MKRLARHALLFLAAMGAALFLTHVVAFDGANGIFLARLFPDDTEFAPDYSAWGFWLVRPGMSDAEVVRLLGQPLSKGEDEHGMQFWRYSRSPSDKNYRLRVVQFVPVGRVMSRYSEYYVD